MKSSIGSLGLLGGIQHAGAFVMITRGGKETSCRRPPPEPGASAMDELRMAHQHIETPGGDRRTIIGEPMPDIVRFFAEHPRRS